MDGPDLDLIDEVTCAICLNIYTDPVTLPCGHSFCRTCFGAVLDAQGMSGYSCPECREINIIEKHVLTEPTTSLKNRKCSVHKKVLEYYCCEDAACICVSCRLDGEHRGHQVETLNETSEKKKEKLRNILQKLTSQREETEERVQNLEVVKRQVRGKTIFRQAAQVSLPISDLIQQLEIKKEELTRKMGDIKELCDMTNQLTVLQEQESNRADYCDAEDTERHDIKVHDVENLDVGLIAETLHSGLARIVTKVTRQPCVPEAPDMLLRVNTASDMLLGVNTASDMLLDVNTAGDGVSVSEDLKTVSLSEIFQSCPETPERFLWNQVLSSNSFSTGRHYWEVEGSESGGWVVGMTYPSIKRKGVESWIGDNYKSWCLENCDNLYSVKHDSKEIPLPLSPSCHRFGIFLDYEAGRLSFYELCDPIRRLYSFTATFTEPLHAIFGC
uniref:Uncharacterized protein n=1 Tax=Leptobrachium leishanense TaxID=445787 RepID=A0A8C5PUA3_9ANUR